MNSSHAVSGIPLTFLPQNGQGKRWHAPTPIAGAFLDSFPEYPRVVLQLLYNRGLHAQAEIDEFFNPDYGTDVHNPFLFSEMERSVERIFKAIDAGEKILIYGDYDADGVCGSVVLHTALLALSANVKVYIPDRFLEGYGLNEKAIAEIVQDKEVGVIITVDCGVSDNKEVDFLKEKGIDVIIVDHHLVPPVAPPAFSILNPKKDGESYPFKYLCATGVAFKLASALVKSERAKQAGIAEGYEKWLLDVVATGTVADMVPLLGENRTLVKYGLIVFKRTKRAGMKELVRLQPARMNGNGFSIEKGEVNAETIAFSIAPRINAASRMAHASVSFKLLVTEDTKEAERLAEKVEELNNDRRKTVDKIMKEAALLVDSESVLCVGNDEWPVGVVGLVSSRLTEKHGKPSFVYGRVHHYFRGSCRGVSGFNVVEAMRWCNEQEKGLLMEFGGHPMAGGFSILPDKFARFRELLLEYARKTLNEETLHPLLAIDAQVAPEDITWELFDWLSKFEPFGEGNRKPVFLLLGATIVSMRAVGQKEDHLKVRLKTNYTGGVVKYFDCIGFSLSSRMSHCDVGDVVDIAFELEANTWNGIRELQLKLKDIRKA